MSQTTICSSFKSSYHTQSFAKRWIRNSLSYHFKPSIKTVLQTHNFLNRLCKICIACRSRASGQSLKSNLSSNWEKGIGREDCLSCKQLRARRCLSSILKLRRIYASSMGFIRPSSILRIWKKYYISCFLSSDHDNISNLWFECLGKYHEVRTKK